MASWREACLSVLGATLVWLLPAGGAADEQECIARFPTERISLELRGVEVQTALRLFAHQHRINLVMTDEVTSTITLSLFEVPVREVFRAILDAANLQCIERGGVMRVGKAAASKPPAPQLPIEIKGIVSLPGGPVAIVNNQVVKVGDLVDGHRVERITDTEVVLRQPDGSPRSVTLPPAVPSTAPRR